jgi:small-conductance mechanosensitive channel
MTWPELAEQWASLLDFPLFRLGNTTLTAATLLTVLIIVLATLFVSRMVGRWLESVAHRRSVEEAGSVQVTARLVHYSILFIGFGIALHTAGIDLTALFAAGAIFGVIIGFAMQNISANFVSGVILLFERTIKPGDILEVDGRIVT